MSKDGKAAKPFTFARLPFDPGTVTGTLSWVCYSQTVTWGWNTSLANVKITYRSQP